MYAQELANRFRSPFVDRVVLVIQGLPPADSEEGEQALATIVDGTEEGTRRIRSRFPSRFARSDFPGQGGGTFVLVGLAPTDGPVESLVPKLRERANSLQNQLRGRYPAVKLELTGETPLNFDIRKASADDVQHGESLVIPATLALLLVAFGSFVAALIPLAVGQLAIAMTMAIAGFLALIGTFPSWFRIWPRCSGWDWGSTTRSSWSAASGKRFAAGHNGLDASAIAARQAGHTLLISASTVAIGFSALLTVPISEIRSIGVAGFLVAGTSVLLANTLVPAVLAVLGRRIDAGRLPFTASWMRIGPPHGKPLEAVGEGDRRHPWIAIVLAGAPLLLLASQAARLDTSLPRGDWLPPAAESVHALHTLEEMDRAGIVQSLRVILELPADSISQTDSGWNTLDRLSKRLASDPRADRVISLTTLAESNRSSFGSLSRETRQDVPESRRTGGAPGAVTGAIRFRERAGQVGARAAAGRCRGSHRNARRNVTRRRHSRIECRLSEYCRGPVCFRNGAGCGRDTPGASARVPIAFRRCEGHRSEFALGCSRIRSTGLGLSGWTWKPIAGSS